MKKTKVIRFKITPAKLIIFFCIAVCLFMVFCTNTPLGDLILEEPGYFDTGSWDVSKWGP